MNPEQTSSETEQNIPFEVAIGDILYVRKNIRDAQGNIERDEAGNNRYELEDGWEVIDTQFFDPRDGKTKVLLENPNTGLLKPITRESLENIQKEAEESLKSQENLMSHSAEAAKAVVGKIESRLADESAHMVEAERREAGNSTETEPVISEELVEEIGEEALDGAEVNEPLPEKDISEESLNSEKVESALKRLQEHADARVLLSITDEANGQLKRLETVLQQSDSYPIDAMRTVLKQTVATLHEAQGFYAYYVRHTLSDVEQALVALEDAKEGVVKEPEAISDSRRVTNELRSIMEPLAGSHLRAQVNQLVQMLHQSYQFPLQIEDILMVTSTIRMGLQNETLGDVATRFKTQIDNLVENIQRDVQTSREDKQ